MEKTNESIRSAQCTNTTIENVCFHENQFSHILSINSDCMAKNLSLKFYSMEIAFDNNVLFLKQQ